ncbi:hypothetical protein P9112_000688 [Eukaryota sp. TZLM1-RC]
MDFSNYSAEDLRQMATLLFQHVELLNSYIDEHGLDPIELDLTTFDTRPPPQKKPRVEEHSDSACSSLDMETKLAEKDNQLEKLKKALEEQTRELHRIKSWLEQS